MRRLRLVCLLLLLTPSATASASSWTTLGPLRVDPSPDDSSGVDHRTRVVRTDAGEVVAFGEVLTGGRTPAGPPEQEWVAQPFAADGTAQPAQGLGSERSIAGVGTDAAGTTYVLMRDSLRLHLRRRPAGGSFGPDELVHASAAGHHVGGAALAVDPGGDVAVSWDDSDGSVERWQLATARAGGTFVEVDPASAAVPWTANPATAVALADDGEVVAIRYLATASDGQVAVEALTMRPGAAPVLQPLVTGPASILCADVAASASGRAVAVWHQGGNCSRGGTNTVALREPGQRFTAPATPPVAAPDWPQAVMSRSGTAVVVFASASRSLSYAAPAGQRFGEPIRANGYVRELEPTPTGALASFQRDYGPTGLDQFRLPAAGSATATLGADGSLSDAADLRADCGVALLALDTDLAGRAAAIVKDGSSAAVVRLQPGQGTQNCLPGLAPAVEPAPSPVEPAVALAVHKRVLRVRVTSKARTRLRVVVSVRRGTHRYGTARRTGKPPLRLRVRFGKGRLERARKRHARVRIDIHRGSKHWRTTRRLR